MMPQGQETFRRATNAAAAGLLVQVLLTIVMAILGLATESPALYAATWHFLGGIIIWIILVLLFHQHRLERAESLEAEQLGRADAATAALFDERADDLHIARRRLAILNKWGLGIVGLLLALFLIVNGGILLLVNFWSLSGPRLAESAFFTDALGPNVNTLVLMAVSTAVALCAFLMARYLSGMTRMKQWQLLRGGASYLMGNAVVAALVLIAAVCAHFDVANVMAWLRLVIPGLMTLIGIETLLTFLLGAYRPRRIDEVDRPAFDSRVLGLLTTPESIAKAVSDTINYQFGFEVSRSWFYRLLGRAVTPMVIFALFVLVLSTSVVIVSPHEQAIVRRYGRIVTDTPVGAGLHLKLPWPISSARKYPANHVQHLAIGSMQSELLPGTPILWTNAHAIGDESFLITAPATARVPGEVSDQKAQGAIRKQDAPPSMSLVAADVIVYYRIDDLVEYVRSASDPEAMLKRIGERAVNAAFVTWNVDDLLTRSRTVTTNGQTAEVSIVDELRDRIARDAEGLGIRVLTVAVAGVHPPQAKDVAASFHKLDGAEQDRQSTIEKAYRQRIEQLATVAGTQEHATRIYEAIIAYDKAKELHGDTDDRTRQIESQINQMLVAARGDVAKTIYTARAERWRTSLDARVRAEGFEADLMAYEAAPEYYRVKRFLRVVAEGMKDARKVLVPTRGAQPPNIWYEFKEQRSELDGILK